jgi:hypothetical protein
MTDDNNGWPGAPGVPGESGPYVLRRKDGFEFPAWWSADDHWTLRGGARMRAEVLANLGTTLVGPMLTPAEVAARVAAAFTRGAEAGREQVAHWADAELCDRGLADAIRLLPHELPKDKQPFAHARRN